MVKPFDASQEKEKTMKERFYKLLEFQGRKIVASWYAMQLTHYGGHYSIERMLSLEEYTRSTPLSRVLLMSVSAPLLIFLLVLCQESVPLQDPADGWKANYGFWVRVACLGAVIGYAAASHLGLWLDVPRISTKQTLVFCLLKAIGFVAVGIAAAELWAFPVPFFILSLSMIWPVILVGFLRIVVGAHAFQQMRSRQVQLQRLNKLGTLQGFLSAAYPAYQVLFTKANHSNYELPVLLFLSIFKVVMKNIFTSAASHKEDLIPEQVIFTVDFFDAFYLATFMPKLSTTTLISVLVVHFVQTALELQELHHRTHSILARLRKTAGITNNDTNSDLLTALRSLCYYSELQIRANIRVHSSIPQRLSPEGRKLLEILRCHSLTNQSKITVQPTTNLVRVWSQPATSTTAPGSISTFEKLKRDLRRCSSIQPFPTMTVVPMRPTELTVKKTKQRDSLDDTSKILREALEVLFTSECLVLIEYVEIIIPALYAIYLVAMVHVPSAQYHSEMAGITSENVGSMVSRLFIFALLELATLVVLAVITKRNCGIDAVYQLGFVLETQMPFVLAKLMLWIVFTLTYRVEHFERLTNFFHALPALQLTRCGGKYSIERMIALQKFVRTTSLIRVIVVILAPPLITITVVLCQESIPLQNPAAGWRTNYGFWPRVGMVGMLLGLVLADVIGPWLDIPPLSPQQKIIYGACVGAASIAVGMAASEIWVFPIPFFIISVLIPMSPLLLVFLYPVVGHRKFRCILSRRDQLVRLNKLSWLLGVMCVGYPAFQMIFNKTTQSVYEVPVLLLLPVFRVVMKTLFARLASHKWDIVPEEIVCTVDFFDALYLVTCMPSLSTTSLAVILVVDLVQTALDLFELHQRTQIVLMRLRAANIEDGTNSHNLLSAVRWLCYNSEALQIKKIGGIQVRSCIPHHLSDDDQTILRKMERYSGTKFTQNSSHRIDTIHHTLTSVSIPGCVRSTIAVQPHIPIIKTAKQPKVEDLAGNYAKESCLRRICVVNNAEVLQEVLEVLWISECLVLVEYLEIIVPILYGTFILAMVHLPSAQYHSEMVGVTRENVKSTVSTMFIYALLEFLSFVFLAGIMKRNCSINVLYQLAFVLESRMQPVLSKLMLWMMFTLTYRVAHFGADFTFTFDWIKGN
ncbi:Hypothetical protein PHPALM_14405 [Phytophthora palmivora]|uniref:Transmembrane protein n=1 Tax=Phytophthora palmivora TaxID=4796 RepID=A0A2P4XUW2_9STRA|nr:Hypothetical protein PHPALM_14405 [Phytophthora palmivora]